MSKVKEPEIFVISDDEDMKSVEETSEKTSDGNKTEESHHKNDSDSDCEITDVSVLRPGKLPNNIQVGVAQTKVADRKKRRKCCNSDCSNSGTIVADGLVTAFYSVDIKDDATYFVCPKCNDAVNKYEEEFVNMVKKKKPFLGTSKLIPFKQDTVVLEDSDDDQQQDNDCGEALSDSELIQVDLRDINATLEDVMKSLDIDFQTDICEQVVEGNLQKLQDQMDDFEECVNKTQKNLDAMRSRLYEPWNPTYQNLPPLIIENDGATCQPVAVVQPEAHVTTTNSSKPRIVAMKKVTQISPRSPSLQINDQMEIVDLGQVVQPQVSSPLPPAGPLVRPPLTVGMDVFVMKSTLFLEWLKAKIVDVVNSKNKDVLYRVKFKKANAPSKLVSAKHLAYIDTPSVQLQVGTRVIAIYSNIEGAAHNRHTYKDHYYAGIIAENLKSINQYRYLIFFDDGCTEYVPNNKVRVVTSQSSNVWEDCLSDCQDFIRTYVQQYPERPMVKLQAGQLVKTEWNTRWWLTRVKKVDCSLALVHFEADNREEWIYRGSTRLGPLFSEMASKRGGRKERTRVHRSFTALQRTNAPYVEYTSGAQDSEPDEPRSLSRAVAKKSTTGRQDLRISLPLSDRSETVGIIKQKNFTTVQRREFVPHQCSPLCIGVENFKEGDRILINPYLIPLTNGWMRDTAQYKSQKNISIFYRSPCVRRLRNMSELHRYLRVTKSNLGVDLFTFDPNVCINTEFVVENPLYSIKDISYEKENVVIPCVNTINHDYPHYVDYTTMRHNEKGVSINTDADFLVCCDCKDDCQNVQKCACRQLTLQEALSVNPNIDPEKFGYIYKRLTFTDRGQALYECNSRCKCASTCLNRVVQHKMKVQLQLFKTERRGWGIRTLIDLPAGQFLCIYAGYVLTEQAGNEVGKKCGDEYLAELDYIEVIEQSKDGYESDITDIEAEDNQEDSDSVQEQKDSEDSQGSDTKRGSDDEFKAKAHARHVKTSSMTLRQRNASTLQEQDAGNMPESSGYQLVAKKRTGEVRAPRHQDSGDNKTSTRYFLDGSNDIYVMDAKSKGNLGRYFNHSCDPNVFVQNVFVDTHDARFPWVSFFTMKSVKAGTELCWNYNYEIGSVAGKRLDCYCGTSVCRGRLL